MPVSMSVCLCFCRSASISPKLLHFTKFLVRVIWFSLAALLHVLYTSAFLSMASFLHIMNSECVDLYRPSA